LHKFFLAFWLWYVVSCICMCGGKDDIFVDKVTIILSVKRLHDKACH